MPDPSSDDTILQRRRNGAGAHANGKGDADEPATPKSAPVHRALPAFFGTLGALVLFAILCVAVYFGYHALTSTAASKPAPVAQNEPVPAAKIAQPLNDPSTWVLSAEPAQNLTGDGNADIGWWTRTFDLPNEGKVTDYLKAQGITVASVVPLHYEDTKDATTITYQVEGEIPAQLLRVPKATWAPADPDLKPFAPVVVLNHNLPAGQFWNTASQTVAEQAGTKLDFAWKVQLDKTANTVTADRLPLDDGVFTPQEVAQFETETNDTVNQLRAQVQAIDARVQADTQAKLAQVPANPPKPELMSTHWNHGDGSGEPTKSAERIGGGTAAGAAGGAAFGAAAGDAGLGAGIGAGVGLLGGFIYDTVSKNNDRHRYEEHAQAVNAERMSDWHDQIKALDQQRAQVQQDGDAEKQQQLQDLATRIASVGGHLDQLPAPADTPQPATYSDAPQIQPQAELSSQQPSGPIGAPPSDPAPADPTASGGGSAPTAVEIVYPPGEANPYWGNVQVTYAGGQTKLLTQNNKAAKAQISSSGLVGWIYATGTPPKPDYMGDQDYLAVRLPDGRTKKFKPNDRIIQKWDFTDGNTAIVMADMDYHGPLSFIKYDLRSGQVIDQVQGYVEHEKLPDWAKPFDDM